MGIATLAYLNDIESLKNKNVINYLNTEEGWNIIRSNDEDALINLPSNCPFRNKGEHLSKKYDVLNYKASLKELIHNGTEIITIKDEQYPKLLRDIENPPLLLYKRGNIDFQSQLITIAGGSV